jgi:hypothetical protein
MVERRWPEPFKKSGAWPLSELRQAFLNCTLERVLDPDAYLRSRLPQFVANSDFGFASGRGSGATETLVGADGILEVRVRHIEGEQRKALLFQAKNDWHNDPKLAKQALLLTYRKNKI